MAGIPMHRWNTAIVNEIVAISKYPGAPGCGGACRRAAPAPSATIPAHPTREEVSHGLPDRDRHDGRGAGAGGPVLGRPDRALAQQLPHRPAGEHAARDHPGLRVPQEGRRARQRGARRPVAGEGRPDRARLRRDPRRAARRRIPPGDLADRQRHPEQHERERGDREPCARARRREARRRKADAQPERRRQQEPVEQRHVPDRDAYRRVRARGRGDAARRAEAPRRARRQSARLREDRQDRPHALHGCDAAHARPGVRRLRAAARQRDAGDPECARNGARARARRHRGRHRAERSEGLRGARREKDRRADRPSRSSPRRTSSRRLRPTTRWSSFRAR